MFKFIVAAIFAIFVTLSAAHEHNHGHSTVKANLERNKMIKVQEITFECTYRCSVYNTCLMRGAWNGDISGCGAEPAGCQCVW